jgi:hypothetical protein
MAFHTYLQGVTSGTFNIGLSQGTPASNTTTSTYIPHRPSSPWKKDSGIHAHHQNPVLLTCGAHEKPLDTALNK